MTGWADITIEELRAELDAYAGEDGMGMAEGWYTMEELTALYKGERHTLQRWLTQLRERGRVEQGKRPDRAVDGRRIYRTVYRLVAIP